MRALRRLLCAGAPDTRTGGVAGHVAPAPAMHSSCTAAGGAETASGGGTLAWLKRENRNLIHEADRLKHALGSLTGSTCTDYDKQAVERLRARLAGLRALEAERDALRGEVARLEGKSGGEVRVCYVRHWAPFFLHRLRVAVRALGSVAVAARGVHCEDRLHLAASRWP